MSQVGISTFDQDVLKPYFFDLVTISDKGCYYPKDLSDSEFESLPETAKQPNTFIRRNEGKIEIIPFEQKYRTQCQAIAQKLRMARKECDNVSFCLYLDAKILELETGSKEARLVADSLWIKSDYKIDLVLSTALEVYMDDWKSIKGSPSASVMVKNTTLDSLVSRLRTEASIMEREAPSDGFRKEIKGDLDLHLRAVDVVRWTGDYATAPYTTVAQCLPNDEWLKKNLGAVNMFYVNTGATMEKVSKNLISRLFFPKQIFHDLEEHLTIGSTIHSMIHEIGHTTGQATDPAKRSVNPEIEIGSEYNALEELRAELFGMYGVFYCLEKGIISQKEAMAAHYQMLASMIVSLKYALVQAHQKARTVMFHYFQRNGSILIIEEEEEEENGEKKEDNLSGSSKTAKKVKKFQLVIEKLKPAVLSFLGRVQDIKSNLDKKATEKLFSEFCFEDPLKEEIVMRSADAIHGRGMIFPSLVPPSEQPQSSSSSSTPASSDSQKGVIELADGWSLKYPSSFTEMRKDSTFILPEAEC
eukprot:MONOS_14318.1-p1 / transcript=MONOS_14318.1 / gene=MONOS_14318 / organism=Monocercomonoides_exilis_PA203 / gene_product=Zn-dependent hydrolase / transcript_product=Zn-dependent hydrolase / location=Mono_scaffold00979:12372-14127(-) / protein_length=529 / sequence_SO=supercontig / SO=protein_coding / is_pseudo=false